MNPYKFAIVALASFLVIACSKPVGDEFVGSWQNIKKASDVMEVTRNGDSFLAGDEKEGRFTAKVGSDGTLQVQGPFGAIGFSYVKESDALVGNGREYKRLK
jgi:hypothetical protein